MRACAALAVLAFAAAPAAADPFPLAYAVDYKFLKQNVRVAERLTFALFADAACTVPVGTPFQLNAGDPSVVFEKVTRVSLSGAQAKPAAVAMLRTTADLDAPPPARVYLEVSGYAIHPAAEECQVQSVAVPGPIGAAGATGVTGAQGHRGPTGPQGPGPGSAGVTGGTGPQGAEPAGPAGEPGAAGATGVTGPTGIDGVTTATFSGPIGTVHTGTFDEPAFLGPTAAITTIGGQRLIAVGHALLGPASPAFPSVHVLVDFCYTPFGGGDLLTFNLVHAPVAQPEGGPVLYPAAASVVPGAGTWRVGLCVFVLDFPEVDWSGNGNANGWVRVVP